MPCFVLAARRGKSSPNPKEIEAGLEQDHRLYFQFCLAEKLHMTLNQLKSEVTEEEMALWAAYFEVKAKRGKKYLDKIKKQR